MNDYQLLLKQISDGEADFDACIPEIVASFMLIRDGEAFSELLQENSGEIATFVRQYSEKEFYATAIGFAERGFDLIKGRIVAQAKDDLAELKWQAQDNDGDDLAEERHLDGIKRARDMNSTNRWSI